MGGSIDINGGRILPFRSHTEQLRDAKEIWRARIREGISNDCDQDTSNQKIDDITGKLFLYVNQKEKRDAILGELVGQYPHLKNYLEEIFPQVAKEWDE